MPNDIPADPGIVYRNKGWEGWGDWLGTGRVATHLRRYRPFVKARAFVRSLGLHNQKDWYAYIKSGNLPSDIPAAPNNTYKDAGWAGLGDWLGTGTIAPRLRRYRPFSQARAYARSQHIIRSKEWIAFTKSGRLPSDIPADPSQTYRKTGWINMGDWLGTGRVATRIRRYRSFSKARKFARNQAIKSEHEWRAFIKSGRLPYDIPSAPDRAYKDQGWAGWGDWLGNRRLPQRIIRTKA